MHTGLVIAGLVLWGLLASVGLYVAYQAYGEADAQAKANLQLYRDERARTGRIQSQVQAVQRERDKAKAELKEALNADPTWRDAAVPGAVRDSLCKRLRCK